MYDLQAEFQSIKDSVVRQKLPKDLKFNGSSKGIKNQVKDVAKAYATSGKFLETSIKIASNIQLSKDDENYDVSSDIDDLLICLIAHMRVVQEEHCMLSVGGNYGPRTQQIFRSIHSNPSQYTPSVIEELRTSATLAALPPEFNNPNNGPGFRPGRDRDFRGGFRSNGFRGRGRGFGQPFQSQSDNTGGYRSRPVPVERQDE